MGSWTQSPLWRGPILPVFVSKGLLSCMPVLPMFMAKRLLSSTSCVQVKGTPLLHACTSSVHFKGTPLLHVYTSCVHVKGTPLLHCFHIRAEEARKFRGDKGCVCVFSPLPWIQWRSEGSLRKWESLCEVVPWASQLLQTTESTLFWLSSLPTFDGLKRLITLGFVIILCLFLTHAFSV